MIDIDGTAIPLEPGKFYLLLIKNGEIPRAWEHELKMSLGAAGLNVLILRVATDVNNVRVVQLDSAEGAIKVQGDEVEVVK